ncbi:MAG: septal ring lytic transglycosylase RlpA family protein [Bacteroidota bacterium]
MPFLVNIKKSVNNPWLSSQSTATTYLVIVMLFLLSSCQVARSVVTKGPAQKGKLLESGVASWYGPGFHGKKTANGETFNTRALTAAHRTLPFGTRLLVRNVKNGQEVIVRINDRGPYAKNRIIDLSKAAAEKLSMIQAGTASVQLFLLEGNPDDLELDNIKEPRYTVQIAAYQEESAAQQKAATISKGWVKKVTVNGKVVYRVYAGKFVSTTEAAAFKKTLQRQGIGGFVKQVEN